MSGTARRLITFPPATYRSPTQRQLLGEAAPRIPFPIHLVEHDHGLVLFDAGLDPDHVGRPGDAYGELAERIDIDFREEHLIEVGLERLGYTPADVDTVVASHLHFDHAGGLKRFPHARTYVGAGEREYANAPERYCAAWFREDDHGDHLGIRWHEVDDDRDVLGDGAVRILFLPGHTPGSLALRVRLPDRTVILSGDVVHARADLEAERSYPLDVDSLTARASLRRLQRCCADAELWIAHDPDDWERFGGAGELR